ncbi:MAG: hypothetical protein HQM16_18345, partial [Deltaproteobacteria bacterium]|nr:hypothetical protein [Deltaproteobacteria bacterium]
AGINTAINQSCSATCTIVQGAYCGDGSVDEGEECDDGNTANDDGCTAQCYLEPSCTIVVDKSQFVLPVLQDGEEAVEATVTVSIQSISTGAATPDNVAIGCGDDSPSHDIDVSDGIIEGKTATCMYSNAYSARGYEIRGWVYRNINGTIITKACNAVPVYVTSCGDGFINYEGLEIIQPESLAQFKTEAGFEYEACDMGNINSDEPDGACRTNCQLAGCGDGIVDGGEECDAGTNNSDSAPNACRTNCTLAHCGDSVIDDSEECDGDTAEVTCTGIEDPAGACVIDYCPDDGHKVAPGSCGCGVSDEIDTDGDGTPDCNDTEECDGVDNNGDGNTDEDLLNACGACGPVPDETCDGADNDCDGDTDEGMKNACGSCGPAPDEICDSADNDCDGNTDEGFDVDNDGTADCNDGCPDDASKTAPGTCGCGVADADSDNDGTKDCNDGCVNDASKTAPGICGCNVADTDSDGDGTHNCNDGCVNDASKTAPGICGCGVAEAETAAQCDIACSDGTTAVNIVCTLTPEDAVACWDNDNNPIDVNFNNLPKVSRIAGFNNQLYMVFKNGELARTSDLTKSPKLVDTLVEAPRFDKADDLLVGGRDDIYILFKDGTLSVVDAQGEITTVNDTLFGSMQLKEDGVLELTGKDSDTLYLYIDGDLTIVEDDDEAESGADEDQIALFAGLSEVNICPAYEASYGITYVTCPDGISQALTLEQCPTVLNMVPDFGAADFGPEKVCPYSQEASVPAVCSAKEAGSTEIVCVDQNGEPLRNFDVGSPIEEVMINEDYKLFARTVDGDFISIDNHMDSIEETKIESFLSAQTLAENNITADSIKAVDFDSGGNLYILAGGADESTTQKVVKYSPAGTVVSDVLTEISQTASAITVDSSGMIYLMNGSKIDIYDGTSKSLAQSIPLSTPTFNIDYSQSANKPRIFKVVDGVIHLDNLLINKQTSAIEVVDATAGSTSSTALTSDASGSPATNNTPSVPALTGPQINIAAGLVKPKMAVKGGKPGYLTTGLTGTDQFVYCQVCNPFALTENPADNPAPGSNIGVDGVSPTPGGSYGLFGGVGCSMSPVAGTASSGVPMGLLGILVLIGFAVLRRSRAACARIKRP